MHFTPIGMPQPHNAWQGNWQANVGNKVGEMRGGGPQLRLRGPKVKCLPLALPRRPRSAALAAAIAVSRDLPSAAMTAEAALSGEATIGLQHLRCPPAAC
jgi:hypothetical protein